MENKIDSLVTALLGAGVSKYEISRHCGVHWNTVQMWARGVFQPSEKYRWAMTTLLMEVEAQEAEKKLKK